MNRSEVEPDNPRRCCLLDFSDNAGTGRNYDNAVAPVIEVDHRNGRSLCSCSDDRLQVGGYVKAWLVPKIGDQ